MTFLRRFSRVAPTRTPASFDDADADLLGVLEGMEGAKNYAAWLLDLIRPSLRGRILEVGAGRGTYSAEFARIGTVTAYEPSASQCIALRERVAGTATRVVNDVFNGADEPGSYDTAVLLNVLEHIPDDVAAVRALHDALAPGGKLVLWVPAFDVLYADFDRRVGHYRRYRKAPLRAQLLAAGFTSVDIRYANLPGFFAWGLIVKLLGRTPTSGGLAALYDRWVVPGVRAVERRVTPPFGQSLLAVATRG